MAVLLSVRPKWCELIASGKKTVEVRKTRPKIETPFKCYIYCTKPKMITKYVFKPEDYPEYMRPEKPVFCKVPDGSSPYCSVVNGNGKVIGEFECDVIFTMSITYSDPTSRIALKEFPYTCLTDQQIIDYLGNGNQGYGWHISNLVIYDKPKEIRDFCYPTEKYCEKEMCGGCPKDQVMGLDGDYAFDCEWQRPIKRPPQSWCYVQDLEE
jgi:predicted transcriptional regulator|nr:MAG TPA: hypothetical protein [Caudoviricetes sp.]